MIARTSVVNYILCFCLAVSVHIHMSPERSLLFKCLGSGPGEVPRQNTVKHLLMCSDKVLEDILHRALSMTAKS